MVSLNKAHISVTVGMSGGVDSAVAAWLLKKEGYHVIGLFMKNWEEQNEDGHCMSEKDFQDVALVCDKIGIEYHAIDFVKEYKEHVFAQFINDFKKGLTPNPDVLCNREIKFKVFYEKARLLGADFLATGHYCRTDGRGSLLKGLDPNKDQSYFLYMVNGEVLKNVLFPIGEMNKAEVRKMAKDLDLSVKDKKDSTGICFIGERNFKRFLLDYIVERPGCFKTLDGEIVGRHSGVQFYTLGQRKGLGLGGPGEAWFVVKKDFNSNIVYVERGGNHPALYSDELIAGQISWINPQYSINWPASLNAKIRYRQKDQKCMVYLFDKDRLKIIFDQPQRAVTPGQSIVFYDDDRCLGGAIIEESGPSYHDQNKKLPDIISS